MITILCPTRARPEQFRRMCDSVKSTHTENVSVMAIPSQEDYLNSYMQVMDNFKFVRGILCAENMATSLKWNIGANFERLHWNAKLFVLGADDMVFTTPGWDKKLIELYEALPANKKAHVFALQDSRDKDGTPHPIFTREWLDLFGWIANPIFNHFYVDTWAVNVAKACGAFTHVRDYGLEHIKPSDNGNADETHSRIRSVFGWDYRDKQVYNSSARYMASDVDLLMRSQA